MQINSPKDLANYCKNHRQRKKQSQSELADLVGLRQSSVSNFETNPEGTKIATLFKILAAAGIEMHLERKGRSTRHELWCEEW